MSMFPFLQHLHLKIVWCQDEYSNWGGSYSVVFTSLDVLEIQENKIKTNPPK